jgi:hypothetical protein
MDRPQHIVLVEQQANVAEADASELLEDLLSGEIKAFEALSLDSCHLVTDSRQQAVALCLSASTSEGDQPNHAPASRGKDVPAPALYRERLDVELLLASHSARR